MAHRQKRPSDAITITGAGATAGRHHHHPSTPSTTKRHRPSSPPTSRPTFPSYKDVPDLPPKIRLLCEILSSATSTAAVEPALEDAGVRVTASDVEQVLRLSYSYPGPAVAFFRWAGHRHLRHLHSPYSWNLVVDLLGKNRLFPSMWDSVSSMHSEGLLSLATFASVFSSLASAQNTSHSLGTSTSTNTTSPIEAFLKMPLYGLPRDTPALNSLLSALCRASRLADARAALPRARAEAGTIPDADSFAILLEGCEAAADPHAAREVFDEMVAALGWDPGNVPAYDSFLTTLVSNASAGLLEAMQYLDILRRHRCSPGEKFFRAALAAHLEARDARGAAELWDEFIRRRGLVPDKEMYDTMISLHCFLGHAEFAIEYLDDMALYGVFPDAETYNMLLQFLLKGRKLREVAAIFSEMAKNECWPSEANCALALRMFMDTGDWEMGIRVWKCMVANNLPPLEESGNMLVSKLRDMERLPEACKYAEDMIDRGIKLSSSTLSKLKQSLLKVNKGSIHDHLLRKWKAH